MESVTIRVPATTANLAAGFDVLGCALGLYNTLTFTPSDELFFEGCDLAYQNENNLAVQAYRRTLSAMGRPMPGVRVRIDASIPVSRGLGSSAALIAAGALAANALHNRPFGREELLALTTEIEGHPDNLAPALFGGLTASMRVGKRVVTMRYALHPSLRFVALVPDFPLRTQEARAVLPKEVPHADAVFNAAHVAVLLKALELGEEPVIAAALDDRLHQPYRKALIPEYDDVRRKAAENGCGAFCISGAGPALLCITKDPRFAERIRESVGTLSHAWRVWELPVDREGAKEL